MMKYELALVLSAKIEDEEREAMVEKVQAMITTAGAAVSYTHLTYYTTAVWVGRDDNRIMESLSGASYPKSIWSNFMNAIHSEYSSTDSMGGNYTDYQGDTTQQTGTQATTATQSSTKGTEATTAAPTTAAPTTAAPTTAAPTTAAPTTSAPQPEEQSAENQ